MAQEIKPTYVNFEQAKWLKEKGFNVECLCFYCINTTCNYIDKPYKYSFEINANQENFVNGKLDNFGYGETYSAPEQWQVVEWLLQNHEIWITVTSISQESWQWHITKPGDVLGKLYEEDFHTPQQAYSAAFDYVLNNLI
jgi:hypothetical protein